MEQHREQTLRRVLKIRRRELDRLQVRMGMAARREQEMEAARTELAKRLVRMAPPGACASPELLFAALREMSEERQRTDGEREKASAELASARSSAGALHAECEGIETHLKRCRDALRGSRKWR